MIYLPFMIEQLAHALSVSSVIPAKAGIQNHPLLCLLRWIPAFAGMTESVVCKQGTAQRFRRRDFPYNSGASLKNMRP